MTDHPVTDQPVSEQPGAPRLGPAARAGLRHWLDRSTNWALGIGIAALLVLTMEPAYARARFAIEAVLWGCLALFIRQWLVRLAAGRSTADRLRSLASVDGVIDTLAAVPVPLALACGVAPKSAWLFGSLWLLKLVPQMTGLRQLRRVMVREAGPLASVLAIFLLVLLVASTLAYLAERDDQPEAFGSVPAALWWAVTTLTTTGYGDVVPHTPLGRLVASGVMICGVAIFGLWTGILANGFAAEQRRQQFIKTWESVSRVPFFSQLGPATITDVTQMLRRLDLPPRITLIRKGTPGDCMYFIAAGEVEVELPDKRIALGEGAFFGEMALLGNNTRSANVVTRQLTTLLVLDLVEFRLLMARHPELASAIDAEARRRQQENAGVPRAAAD
jgi:voltage-gated potassium channel